MENPNKYEKTDSQSEGNTGNSGSNAGNEGYGEPNGEKSAQTDENESKQPGA